MKQIILNIAFAIIAIMFSTSADAQQVKIFHNDGTVTTLDLSKIDRMEFSEEPIGFDKTLAYGTWSYVYSDERIQANRLTINPNGTFKVFHSSYPSMGETGIYTIEGDKFSVKFDDENSWTIYTVEKLTANSLVYYTEKEGKKIYYKLEK